MTEFGEWILSYSYIPGKNHLIMVYDAFYILLNQECSCFVEDFCMCIPQIYWPIIFFSFFFFFFLRFFIWFWCQGNCCLVVWECSHLFGFLKQLEKNRYQLFFMCLVEFPSDVVHLWTFVCQDFFLLLIKFYYQQLVCSDCLFLCHLVLGEFMFLEIEMTCLSSYPLAFNFTDSVPTVPAFVLLL